MRVAPAAAGEEGAAPMDQDLLRLLRRWISESRLLDGLPPTAPGPTRLIRHCLGGLVIAAAGPPESSQARAQIPRLLDMASPALRTDLRSAAECAGITAKRCASQGRPLTSDQLQTKVARHLSDLLAPAWIAVGAGDPPSMLTHPRWDEQATTRLAEDLQCAARTTQVRAWVVDAKAHPAMSFIDHWSDEFAHAWTAMEHDRPDPREVGLGERARPPLAGDATDADGWRAATDRPVHNRVTLYWDPRHLPSPADVSAAGGALPSVRFSDAEDPGHAVVMESVSRTCAPLGLHDPRHRELVRCVHDSVTDGWDGPPLPAGHSAAGLANAWSAVIQAPESETAHRVLGQQLLHLVAARCARVSLTGSLSPTMLAKFVVRRLWLRMHAWELAGATLPAHALHRTLGPAIDVGVTAPGVSRPFAGHQTRSEASRLRRSLRVLDRIRSDEPDLDPGAVIERYQHVADSRCVSAKELRALLGQSGSTDDEASRPLFETESG